MGTCRFFFSSLTVAVVPNLKDKVILGLDSGEALKHLIAKALDHSVCPEDIPPTPQVRITRGQMKWDVAHEKMVTEVQEAEQVEPELLDTSTEPMQGVRSEPVQVICDDNVQTVEELVDFSIPVVKEGGNDKSVFIEKILFA